MTYAINDWINQTISDSSCEWMVLTFRSDAYVCNGHNRRQSVWNTNVTCSIEKVKKALDWTVTEFKRKNGRRLRFVSYLGGEQHLGIFPHIHGLIELPNNMSELQLKLCLEKLWIKKLKKIFKEHIESSVHVEKLKSLKQYTSYCARYEGNTFNIGDEKVLLNKSFNI
jgi:hypothetical protein